MNIGEEPVDPPRMYPTNTGACGCGSTQ